MYELVEIQHLCIASPGMQRHLQYYTVNVLYLHKQTLMLKQTQMENSLKQTNNVTASHLYSIHSKFSLFQLKRGITN